MKFTSTLLLVFFSIAASAQIQKGKVGLSGSFLIETGKASSSISTGVTKTSSAGIDASVGFFVSDRFFLSALIGYGQQKEVEDYGTSKLEQTLHSTPLGIEAKWYKRIAGKFYYNANLRFVHTWVKGEVKSHSPSFPVNSSLKGTAVSAAIQPVQVTYALSNKFLVEAGFGNIEYASSKLEQSTSGAPAERKADGFAIGLSPILSNIRFTFIF